MGSFSRSTTLRMSRCRPAVKGGKNIFTSRSGVLRSTARHLGLKESEIIPVSAKQGLLSKVRDDHALLLRSQILDLEKLLSDAVLGNRRQLLLQGVVQEVAGHIEDSLQVLDNRQGQIQLRALQERRGALNGLFGGEVAAEASVAGR